MPMATSEIKIHCIYSIYIRFLKFLVYNIIFQFFRSFTVDPEFSTDERLQKRAARFEVKGNKKQQSNSLVFTISNPFIIDETGDFEWSSDAIIGTCLDLEKPFLRLTGVSILKFHNFFKYSIMHIISVML